MTTSETSDDDVCSGNWDLFDKNTLTPLMATNHLTPYKYHLMLMSEYCQINRVTTIEIRATVEDLAQKQLEEMTRN